MAEKEKSKEIDERARIRSRCNICEEEGKILLQLEMPGVHKDDVDINVENNQLEILGKRTNPTVEGDYLVQERRTDDFYQLYTIDNTIDRAKIEAELVNGILTVTLHIKESEKPRQIQVQAG